MGSPKHVPVQAKKALAELEDTEHMTMAGPAHGAVARATEVLEGSIHGSLATEGLQEAHSVLTDGFAIGNGHASYRIGRAIEELESVDGVGDD